MDETVAFYVNYEYYICKVICSITFLTINQI